MQLGCDEGGGPHFFLFRLARTEILLFSTRRVIMAPVKIFLLGLKLNRLREWSAVVREEGYRVGVKGWVKMAKALWGIARYGVDRNKWRQRLRICHKCPVYDKQLKRCGPWTGAPYGCGCYVPYMAMEDGGPCWARQRRAESGWR